MKTIALALAAFLFTSAAALAQGHFVLAEISIPASANVKTVSNLTTASAPSAFAADSTSHFAQLDTTKGLPVSPTMLVTLIAFLALGVRLMCLRQALSLAEHERHSHHGRAQMFRSLHEERSSLR